MRNICDALAAQNDLQIKPKPLVKLTSVVGERCVFDEVVPKGAVEDTQERMQE
jgi:hypothetical protein